ncbi:hypothetical protein GVN24_21755 [Rhizobium sp. CRIBSB]|nr:hypothetical protein [Rhizobium sp. CRIBSB]
MSFSPTEACFEGFRITRNRPGAIALWSLVWLAGLIAAGLTTIPFLAPYMNDILQSQGGPPSPEVQAAIRMAGYASMPATLLMQAILMPAVYRSVLRPEQKGFGSLRVGMAEVRVLLVIVGIALVSTAVQVVSETLQPIVTEAAGALVWFGPSLLIFLFSVWFGVQTSLMAAATFDGGKISLKEPFALARRHFWPLLGMMVLSVVMALLVILLMVMIAAPLYFVVMQAGSAPSVLALIASIATILLVPLALTLATTIIWAPFAAAWRGINQG